MTQLFQMTVFFTTLMGITPAALAQAQSQAQSNMEGVMAHGRSFALNSCLPLSTAAGGTFLQGTANITTISLDITNRDVDEYHRREAERQAARKFIDYPTELFEAALREVNAFRRINGVMPLQPNTALSSIAKTHLRDLADHDHISHEGTDGSTLGERMQRGHFRYRIVAENLSAGHDTYHDAVEAWIESPDHRRNMLLRDVTQIGMAAIYDDETRFGTFWAMVLVLPLDEAALQGARWD